MHRDITVKNAKVTKMNQTLESDRQVNSLRISQVYVKANYEKTD